MKEFIVDPDKGVLQNSFEYYDVSGKRSNSDNYVACINTTKNGKFYYALVGSGALFDPEILLTKRERMKYTIKQISSKSFDYYLSYLRSRKQTFLRLAVRNIRG